jgi:hypothetical protein
MAQVIFNVQSVDFTVREFPRKVDIETVVAGRSLGEGMMIDVARRSGQNAVTLADDYLYMT